MSTRLITSVPSILCILSLSSCVAFLPLIDTETSQREYEEKHAPEVTTGGGTYVTPRRQFDRTAWKREKYMRQLQEGNATTRAHAAYWLGEMGDRAQPAVPLLIANLTHSNHWVRRASAKALGKIGSPTAVEPLTRALRDPDQFVAHSAANALRKIGTQDARRALKGYRGI